MKVSFKELLGSDAYQNQAQVYAKSMIFVSFTTLVFNYFLSDDASLIGTILLIAGWGLFGTGILVAAPCYVIYVYIVSKMSEFAEFPSGEATSTKGKVWKKTASLWNTVSYAINIYLTFFIAQKFYD